MRKVLTAIVVVGDFHADGRRSRLSYLYVPSRGVLAENGEYRGAPLVWWRVYRSVVRKLRRLSRGLRPFAAPRKWPSEVPLVPGRAH